MRPRRVIFVHSPDEDMACDLRMLIGNHSRYRVVEDLDAAERSPLLRVAVVHRNPELVERLLLSGLVPVVELRSAGMGWPCRAHVGVAVIYDWRMSLMERLRVLSERKNGPKPARVVATTAEVAVA